MDHVGDSNISKNRIMERAWDEKDYLVMRETQISFFFFQMGVLKPSISPTSHFLQRQPLHLMLELF